MVHAAYLPTPTPNPSRGVTSSETTCSDDLSAGSPFLSAINPNPARYPFLRVYLPTLHPHPKQPVFVTGMGKLLSASLQWYISERVVGWRQSAKMDTVQLASDVIEARMHLKAQLQINCFE
ncbi:hypothetical protein CEXT_364661 [Caerostris extrusa]|uniref:Uncharacterized protein n=1 Tax=Caerostris extrusa TaxID=172846 RepID=A0AAV4VC44_CAEEX|nr:hypothetical protein CEXT_364661 [Caerostris extrusa]